MVRELLEQRADLAIADLTITFDREQVNICFYNRNSNGLAIYSSLIFIHIFYILQIYYHIKKIIAR